VSGLRSEVYERLRARVPTTLETVNEIHEAARMRTGRVSMNERGCPCADHATAYADRNRGRKNTPRYPPLFQTDGAQKSSLQGQVMALYRDAGNIVDDSDQAGHFCAIRRDRRLYPDCISSIHPRGGRLRFRLRSQLPNANPDERDLQLDCRNGDGRYVVTANQW
jgi:hypothetical protein